MIHPTLAAAERLAAEGINAEVIDPRTLTPLDEETLIKSVAKTGGAVIVDEGYTHFGATAELASVIAYGAFDYLDAPIERLGAMDVPIPFSPVLEFATIPDEDKIIAAAHRIVEGRRR
jgi:pyruvate dehydrogenase E1 component beta subunit